jgi:hypothetical protein
VRKDHPLRAIRAIVDEVLTQFSRRLDTMYARIGPAFGCAGEAVAGSERLLMEEMELQPAVLLCACTTRPPRLQINVQQPANT